MFGIYKVASSYRKLQIQVYYEDQIRNTALITPDFNGMTDAIDFSKVDKNLMLDEESKKRVNSVIEKQNKEQDIRWKRIANLRNRGIFHLKYWWLSYN